MARPKADGTRHTSLIEKRYEKLLEAMDADQLIEELTDAVSESSLPAIRIIVPKLKDELRDFLGIVDKDDDAPAAG